MDLSVLLGEHRRVLDSVSTRVGKLRGMVKSIQRRQIEDGVSSVQKQRLDANFEKLRTEIAELRILNYRVRSSSLASVFFGPWGTGSKDPIEVFPDWPRLYRGNNLTLPSLNLLPRGRVCFGDGSEDWVGLDQLIANLLHKDDDSLEMWPRYFGHSSGSYGNVNSIGEQSSILDEILFPLSGASLEGAVAVDLETTARFPQDGEILELGIVEIVGSDPTLWTRFSLQFDLSGDLARSLGTGSEYIHGIRLDDVRGCPQITDKKIQAILQRYLCSGRPLIVHNGSFEFKWLSHYVDGFFAANYDCRGHQRIIDTSLLSKIAFQLKGGRGITSNSLESVIGELGLSYENGHSAQADAAMAAFSAHGMLMGISGNIKLKELSPSEYSSVLSSPHDVTGELEALNSN